jgi:predicted PurR-regulated permease PerM
LLERSVFDRKLDQIFRGSDRAARVRLVIREINERIGSYLALKTLLGILLGVLSWLVMKQRGLEFAELWALLIVLFNFIPYLGSILSVLLPVIMSVIQFGQPNEILVLFLLLTVIQFVVGNVVDPYLMGNSLNLSPFAIVVSLAVWSSLWGLSGAFLAIPLTVCLVIVFSEFEATRPVAILLSKNGTLPRFGVGPQD